MKLRYLFGAVLIVVVFLAASSHPPLHADLPDDADPAFAVERRNDGVAYAGINIWALYGMRAERFTELLHNAGYGCDVPSSLMTPAESIAIVDVLCKKEMPSPLHRVMAVHAKVEHGLINRLVGATADSTLVPGDQPVLEGLAGLLRRGGWLEPQSIAHAGVKFDSVDQLARMVVDSMSYDGWYLNCKEAMNPTRCGPLTRDHASDGFPPLPEPDAAIPTASVWVIQRDLERIGFTAVQRRGADNYPEDTLLVRLADRKLWMDFGGADMAGHRIMAALELYSVGGRPKSLTLDMDGAKTSVALNGTPVLANDRAMTYLLPEAGDSAIRHANWVNLPNQNYPGTFTKLIHTLPQVDPTFVEPMVRVMVDHMNTAIDANEDLGLYPPLWLIEKKAGILRGLQPDRWMPREQGNRLIAGAYPGDLIIRAAWAFATCEDIAGPALIDHNCVLRFATADPDAAAMVRKEIADEQLKVAALPAGHPIRMRLDTLADAYQTELNAHAEPDQ